MTTVKLKFALERETKGAVRYQELDENSQPQDTAFATIGTLYVRKTALGKGNLPREITVEVTF